MTRGVAFGNLYLAEKQPAGSFTDEDEEIVTLLAAQAAVAIENAGSVQRDALRRAVQAQEVERRRLARELHDETGRRSCRSSSVSPRSRRRRLRTRRMRPQRSCGRSSSRRCRTSGASLSSSGRRRSTTSASSPRSVASGTAFARQPGLDVQVETTLGSERLTPDVETAVYRIVQEALTNVVKHADAARVSIVVTRKPDSVLVMIEDDGRGFDPADVGRRRPRPARDARARRAARRVAPGRGCARAGDDADRRLASVGGLSRPRRGRALPACGRRTGRT